MGDFSNLNLNGLICAFKNVFFYYIFNDNLCGKCHSLTNFLLDPEWKFNSSSGSKSYSNSGKLLQQPGMVVQNFSHCISCADRNSNVITAPTNSVFLVTAFPIFMFGVGDMNEW